MKIIFNKIEEHYKNKAPFVAYKKPNSEEVTAFFMKNDDLIFTSEFNEKGFVFAPFNSEENAILFQEEKGTFVKENISFEENFPLNENFNNTNLGKDVHISLVEKALGKINKNELKKVVISRKETIELSHFNLVTVFKKLLKEYTNAFVYVWYHPKVGLWFGATPETLLNISDNYFKTMSLAGTQVYEGFNKVVWKFKELEEQQLVTDFIENQLKSISNNLIIDKAKTIKAGNLLHLRTRVEGVLNENSSLKELIRRLHPTPAVCGLPRKNAKDFINLNENYKRTFYTGFLGELNLENKKSSLFVNLRCMSIKDKKASIYVGGGITKDSCAKKEWEETVYKSKTMKKVL